MHKNLSVESFDSALLREKLLGPLPGNSAHIKMAHLKRLEDLQRYGVPPNPLIASVLLLLYFENGQLHTVLMERTVNPNDRHSGQLSFPGGKMEPSDRDLAETALRETREEIGISEDKVELLGALTHLYIPVSNFLVHPFVGLHSGTPDFKLQQAEVRKIITPPLDLFLSPDCKKTKDIAFANGVTLKDVPYYDVQGRVLWGATAMIIAEFLSVLGCLDAVEKSMDSNNQYHREG